MSRQEQRARMTSRNDGQERHTSGSVTRPFIDPVVQGGCDDPKQYIITRIGCSGWALATAQPSCDCRSGSTPLLARWLQATESSCSKPHDMNCLAPNPVPCPGDLRLLLVNVPAPWCAMRPERSSRTACLCLVAAASRRRCGRMSATCGRHLWPPW